MLFRGGAHSQNSYDDDAELSDEPEPPAKAGKSKGQSSTASTPAKGGRSGKSKSTVDPDNDVEEDDDAADAVR